MISGIGQWTLMPSLRQHSMNKKIWKRILCAKYLFLFIYFIPSNNDGLSIANSQKNMHAHMLYIVHIDVQR